ncbi:MAG TPA: helix-turn-helix transcriptional regulator [Solirubrobacterales bacterium]|nr:helix-turn-helix transcriptional regulator [Solirubrobacterales bacterium]
MKSKSIKLTGTSYALLALLREFGEMTSYDIKQAMESSIQNFWPVPHTTAYEEPARLAGAGYLSARQEEGGRRRRVYSLTEEGREALAAWAAEPSAAAPQLRDEAMLKVFAGGDPAPLAGLRLDWHRAKLEELRGYLALVRESEGFEGSERTLLAGIAYEEKMVELLGSLRGAADPG